MLRKTYLCDTCQSERDLEDLIGLVFLPSSGRVSSTDKPETSQQHICTECLKGMVEIASKRGIKL
jgi:hypothetical protein